MRLVTVSIPTMALLVAASFRLTAQSSPIDFICANTRVGGNDSLVWVAPTPTCPGFGRYVIYASTNIRGPYAVVGSVANPVQNSFVRNISATGISVWYYYMVQECMGVEGPPSDTLDNLNPLVAPITAVSIENGQSVVYWHPGASPETSAYNVYIERPIGSGADLPIPAGQVIPDTFFVDANSQAGSHPERYTIRAGDACGALSLRSPYHKTMHLQYTIDPCTRGVTLNWTPYEGWPIDSFEIWIGLGGNPPIKNAVVASSVNTHTYFAQAGEQLCIHIKAINANEAVIHSKSNEVCFVANVNREVDYLYLTNASFLPNGQVELSWLQDTVADYGSTTVIYGYTSNALPYHNPVLTFSDDNDFAAIPLREDRRLYFRASTTDRCFLYKQSNLGSTVYLQGNTGQGLSNELFWSPYLFENGEIRGYEVFRVMPGGSDNRLGYIPQGQPTRFAHELEPIDSDGDICYYVVAHATVTLPNGRVILTKSRSNSACLKQEPRVYIPNAIAPQGVNDFFKPMIVYPNISNYKMDIYNRWGNLVFSTTDPSEGWRGRLNGEPLPSGAYLYQIQFIIDSGEQVVKRGSVSIVN